MALVLLQPILHMETTVVLFTHTLNHITLLRTFQCLSISLRVKAKVLTTVTEITVLNCRIISLDPSPTFSWLQPRWPPCCYSNSSSMDQHNQDDSPSSLSTLAFLLHKAASSILYPSFPYFAQYLLSPLQAFKLGILQSPKCAVGVLSHAACRCSRNDILMEGNGLAGRSEEDILLKTISIFEFKIIP